MNRTSLRFFSCVLLAGIEVSTGGAPARAQPAPPKAGKAPAASVVDESKEADRLFAAGKKAYAAGKLEDAYAAYLQAFKWKPTYDIASNLANTESQLGKKVEAAEHLAFAVRHFPPTGDKLKRQKAEKRFAEARGEVGAALIKVVEVKGGKEVEVPAAEVLVAGRLVGKSPLADEVYVEADKDALVEVRLQTYKTATSTLRTAKATGKSAPKLLSLTMEREPPPVMVDAVPPSNPTTPGGAAPVPAGSATVSTGQPPAEPAKPIEPRRPSVPIIIAGSAVAVVAVVVGGAFLGVAHGKASDADTQLALLKAGGTTCASPPAAGPCTSLHDLNASSDTFHNVGVPLIAVGGAIGVGTLVYALWPRRRNEQPPPVRLVPAAGPGSAGLWLRGSF